MRSRAALALSRSVIGVRPGQPKLVSSAWWNAGPMKSPSSPEHLGETFESPFHRAVQVTLGVEVLASRDDLLRGHRRRAGTRVLEPGAVGLLDVLRALQVDEVLQGRFAEGEQAELHLGRVAARPVREVRPSHERRRADGGEQVLDDRPVQHLLARDVEEHPAPALDGLELVRPKTRPHGALQAERRIEVLAHHRVLELGALREQVGQLLAPLHHDGRVACHARTVLPIDRRPQ